MLRATRSLVLIAAPQLFLVAQLLANPIPERFNSSTFRLVSERVRLSISDSTVVVTGSYFFRTRHYLPEVTVLFPFIADSTLGPPRRLCTEVWFADDDIRKVNVRADAQGWHCALPLGHARKCRVNLTYSQRILGRQASYLLTSARQWHAPLDSMRIELDYPMSFPTPSINLQLEEVSRGNNRVQYAATFRQVTPREELFVRW